MDLEKKPDGSAPDLERRADLCIFEVPPSCGCQQTSMPGAFADHHPQKAAASKGLSGLSDMDMQAVCVLHTCRHGTGQHADAEP